MSKHSGHRMHWHHGQKPAKSRRSPGPMSKEDTKKAKIEHGALRRLITRMLNRDTLEQLTLFGVEGTKKRLKIRQHNAAMKQSWRQMERARGRYGQNQKDIPPPRLVYDSEQGPAARSSNVKTGEVTYIPWKEIAK